MKLFGTDGIRGVAGKFPLDRRTVKRIGLSVAEILKKKKSKPAVLIGRDTRKSGAMIVSELKKGFSSAGVQVKDLGVIPTPGVAYMSRHNAVLAGIVVSASHNPYKDNGIKIFSTKGTKLSDALENKIEKCIHRNLQKTAGKFPKKSRLKNNGANAAASVSQYEKFLQGQFTDGLSLKNTKIVLDCANGSAHKIAPRIFSNFGANILALNVSPDGYNINENCGSLHVQNLSKEVIKNKAFCGIAFDGDADRVIFVDEKGDIRDGDFILAIISKFWKKLGKLKNNTLVSTVMANLGLVKAMDEQGIKLVKASVGDRYVYEAMVKNGAVVGGEQSGHIIFRNILPTGDGILSAIELLNVALKSGKTISELSSVMKKYPQVLLNTKVEEKLPLQSLKETSKLIKGFQNKLNKNGRILVRYSGTENLLRVMVEGLEIDFISNIAKQISEVAVREIEKITDGRCKKSLPAGRQA
jgi:phosphoglucosamine mutase